MARATEAFKTLKVGDPHAADTVVGPLVTEAHRSACWATSRRRSTRAPRSPFGGGVPEHLDKGWYVEPTLLTNVSNDSTVAQEEIFGPVIVADPYDDEADAVRLANDSKFGLSGAVFTSDPVKGFEIARRIRTGTFRVNTMSADFNSSFGGYKESGIGREHGPYAIDEYLLDKTISIEPGEEVPDEVLDALQVVTANVWRARGRPGLHAAAAADWPPSTAISAPLIQLDSSEIRKTTSGATSSAAPARPSGISSSRAVDERLRRRGHRRGHRAGEDRVDADARAARAPCRRCARRRAGPTCSPCRRSAKWPVSAASDATLTIDPPSRHQRRQRLDAEQRAARG